MSRTNITGMTDKERRFCEEYVIDCNGTGAARRAGYSAKSAGKIAYQLLQKQHIMAEINRQTAARNERVLIDQDWVMYRLQIIVDRCLQFKKPGPGKEYSFNASGANTALKMIGVYLGMFTETGREDDLETLLGKGDAERIRGITAILDVARARQAGGVVESPGHSEPGDTQH